MRNAVSFFQCSIHPTYTHRMYTVHTNAAAGPLEVADHEFGPQVSMYFAVAAHGYIQYCRNIYLFRTLLLNSAFFVVRSKEHCIAHAVLPLSFAELRILIPFSVLNMNRQAACAHK